MVVTEQEAPDPRVVRRKVATRRGGREEGPQKLIAIADEQGREPVDVLVEALENTPSVRSAARKLGVSAPTVFEWIRYYNIEVVEGD